MLADRSYPDRLPKRNSVAVLPRPATWWPALIGLLHSGPARPLRFLLVGGLGALVQLGLLEALTARGWDGLLANVAAFVIAAQVNFWLSDSFTWADRQAGDGGRSLPWRWATFHFSIAATAALNLAVFASLRSLLADPPAAALGIGVAGVANFLSGDRFVFGRRPATSGSTTAIMIARRHTSKLDGSQVRSTSNSTTAITLARPATDDRAPAERGSAAETRRERAARRPDWVQLGLLAVLALAAGLYTWGLSRNGLANEYYAAAVFSMSRSWSNFFFGAVDPGGFITVDKPPFAFWVQALSARIFGFGSWSILLPQAVAGVATILVLYHVVQRVFGRAAGLLAALVLALTPITVAINRDNNPDALLVLLMVLAAWGVLRAVETGRTRPLLIGAAMVGIAFNTKMLQGYLIAPAFGLTYLLAAPVSLRRRITQLTAATLVVIAVSASWLVVVDAIPADARPNIGGSQNNTVLDLVLGYNGFGRILGNENGRGGGFGFGGAAGWTRLFNDQVGGQISWLLLLAAVGLAAGLIDRLRHPRGDLQRASFVFWGLWLATHFAVFSFARGIFHPYYTSALAPAVAALCGAGLVTLWRWYRRRDVGALVLPASLTLTATWSYLLLERTDWLPWLRLAVAGLTGIAVAGLLTAWMLRGNARRIAGPVCALGVVAVLAGPAAWSWTPLQDQSNSNNPMAGPVGVGRFGPGGGGQPPARFFGRGSAPADSDGAAQAARPAPSLGGLPAGVPPARPDGFGERGGLSAQLLTFLEQNRGDARYLVAVNGAMSAAPAILETGEAILPMGGFNGSDPAPTVDQLVQLVHSSQLRYVLLGGGFGRGVNERNQWIESHCTLVEPALDGSTTGGQRLYDCVGAG